MAHIKTSCTFRFENQIYEKVSCGNYRLLTSCLESYTDVTDKVLIERLDKHTADWQS